MGPIYRDFKNQNACLREGNFYHDQTLHQSGLLVSALANNNPVNNIANIIYQNQFSKSSGLRGDYDHFGTKCRESLIRSIILKAYSLIRSIILKAYWV
jgi:hypothetical protein